MRSGLPQPRRPPPARLSPGGSFQRAAAAGTGWSCPAERREEKACVTRFFLILKIAMEFRIRLREGRQYPAALPKGRTGPAPPAPTCGSYPREGKFASPFPTSPVVNSPISKRSV